MAEFVSEVKTIPHSDADIYTVLSDLNNLELAKDKIPQNMVKDLSFDQDSCTVTVDPVGKIRFVVVERDPNKTIKFQAEQLPFDVTMWIQLKSSADDETKMKLTIKADLNPFLKPMVSKPLQAGLDKVAESLSALPYADILNKGRIEEQPMKLWEKSVQVNKDVESYTVGRDRELDVYLAPYDVLGSMAHITMLESVGLLTKEELAVLIKELKVIYKQAVSGEFVIEDGIEDVHSQVELMLTRKLGDVGKKIHSGRSRNDQVLIDLKLFTRDQIHSLVNSVTKLIDVLLLQSEKYKNILMPGYTHLQIAMPSSFGLWFGSYAESLVDDLQLLLAAYRICNRNPLGSAAGYGSSFPLNRQMTTDLLGFDSMNYNVVYAQMGRGKMERVVAFAIANIAATLSKLSYDACLYNSQNFGFIKLPDEYTTGSSIMPHKKNPDVFELTRAKCNKLQGLPNNITLITNNLPSGYFRDLQIIKELFIPSFEEMNDCLQMVAQMMGEVKINEHILDDPKYLLIFSVEEVNRLVLEGVPFRDAYKQVGLEIEKGNFSHNKEVHHTHEGSIGNLCNDRIDILKQQVVDQFEFEKVISAETKLLGEN